MSISRRALLLTIFSACLASGRSAWASSPSIGDSSLVDFKKQLETGLRARRPVEFSFIAQVVELMDSGKLPRKLVEMTFLWARRKESKRVQYFEFALRERAKKAGIELKGLKTTSVVVDG